MMRDKTYFVQNIIKKSTIKATSMQGDCNSASPHIVTLTIYIKYKINHYSYEHAQQLYQHKSRDLLYLHT